ncbi:MAG: alkaline phosphatase D family protein [Planctomycetaceae bacterium]|nr:alkaline phosphatase D family protein [Planctomycetaceae bacterium]
MQDEATSSQPVTRRDFLAVAAGAAVVLPHATADDTVVSDVTEPNAGPYQATGTRVGEVTESSAIVWTRLTKYPQRNNDGVVCQKKGDRHKPQELTVPVEGIEGACPGKAGRIRLRYSRKEDLSNAVESAWVSVNASSDFIHKFHLDSLIPDSRYHYVIESAAVNATLVGNTLRGTFETAPLATIPGNLRFCVMTCQGYPDRDHKDGHPIYPSMLALKPKFLTMTGDLVYYDNDAPRAVTPELARLHWERMFSLPRLIEMLRNVSTYWLKDDHDTLTNDSGPGATFGEMTFAEGQNIFRQQAPMGEAGYRTFRWGRDLQLWFTDGRDFRSPNKMPDGPDKTIWGAEQKAWFKRTVLESDATWKVLVSPTPLVGPDRGNKNDNHSNAGFAHEGDEIRGWLKANVPNNFFVVCGDRHWQYHSVHPTSGLHEFSVGAASDSHAGGTPGENKDYHRFHRVKGGFLSVELVSHADRSQIIFQMRDVNGVVVYETSFDQVVA